MTVSISWIDPEETIAYFQLMGLLTIEDYFDARYQLEEELRKRGDPQFDTIHDLSQITNLTLEFTGSIATITTVMRKSITSTERFPVVIENRSHVIRWIKIGVKAMSFLSVSPPHFVETYDEALLKIAELRSGLDE